MPTTKNYQRKTYPLTDAMTNELVGDRGDLTTSLTDVYGVTKSGTNFFFFRGKNGLDMDTRTVINQTVNPMFTNIATWIILYESKQSGGNQPGSGKEIWHVFNQFNVSNSVKTIEAKAGTPNMASDGKGWGMGQITETSYSDRIVPTRVVWDWTEHIREMKRIINQKYAMHTDFISNIRWKYGNASYWVEPPATYTTNGITLTFDEWAVLVLYNGGGGIPPDYFQISPTKTLTNQSPWQINSGSWVLHDNNKNYIRKITKAMNDVTNGVVIILE